jgi:hypothetical protein
MHFDNNEIVDQVVLSQPPAIAEDLDLLFLTNITPFLSAV